MKKSPQPLPACPAFTQMMRRQPWCRRTPTSLQTTALNRLKLEYALHQIPFDWTDAEWQPRRFSVLNCTTNSAPRCASVGHFNNNTEKTVTASLKEDFKVFKLVQHFWENNERQWSLTFTHAPILCCDLTEIVKVTRWKTVGWLHLPSDSQK